MPSWISSRRLSAHFIRRKSRGQTIDSPKAYQEKEEPIPDSQAALILHGPKQRYQLTEGYPIPEILHANEVLIRTQVIGLNPIDWKAPDFNFGIPQLPYISGRESSGVVVRASQSDSRTRLGDRVIVISTDYRDLRKSTFQEYVVASDFNLVRLPPSISLEAGATMGVTYVAAALALGVCLGVDFSDVLDGPDLHHVLREIDPSTLPHDVREECLEGISSGDRARPGDWLVVWGASATSAYLAIQLAYLVGLKVIAVLDTAKHGLRLSYHESIRPDILVDNHDPKRAVQIIKANIRGSACFGLDTIGATTATHLLEALSPECHSPYEGGNLPHGGVPSPPETPSVVWSKGTAHLVGLSGIPKGVQKSDVMLHSVPIKLFHDVPQVGHMLVTWLERLLDSGSLAPPEIVHREHGLLNVNEGLDRMRLGHISGGKAIVTLK